MAIAEAPVVDAEIVDDTQGVSTALAVRSARRSEVMRPLPAAQLVESFHEYQQLCEALLIDSDYQAVQDGKKFKKKSAWRKLAVAFDLDVTIVRETVERDEQGHIVRAAVVARAVTPSGRYQDGDGYCDRAERRFTKPEHDIRATATTRAKNRAISDLLGTGEVSAEEVDARGEASGQLSAPKFGVKTSPQSQGAASRALVKLCGGDRAKAEKTWKEIVDHMGGYMPDAAALAIRKVASAASIVMTHDDTSDVPWGDGYVPPEGPVTDAEVVTDSEPTAAEIMALQSEAFQLWTELEDDRDAEQRVEVVGDNPAALRGLIAAAKNALKEAQK